MITIKNVKKIFPSKQGQLKAVDDVNVVINEGEIFGIIGYSGAGKSTLIRMLNGLEIPTEGSITVGKRETRFRGGKRVSLKLGRVRSGGSKSCNPKPVTQPGRCLLIRSPGGSGARQAREPPRAVRAEIPPGNGLRLVSCGVLTGAPP